MNRLATRLILVAACFLMVCCATQEITKEEKQIEELLAQMSIDDKIGQTALRGTSSRVKGALSEEFKQAVRDGQVGSVLNVMNVEYVKELQGIAVEESRLGIPLIFARDVIHGFKTIFPIPIGLAASWDEQTAYDCARVSALEASSQGIRWTFAPMLDIARDSRWGRVAESPGEDPYLASILAKAYIRGFQGDSLSDPSSMAACAKHFLGYGAAIGGRDYNSVVIHNAEMQNIYLPPFKAAIDAGSATIMSSFNDINGIPATGNRFILRDILRDQLGFNGFVVSDWNSVTEMIPHGFAADEKEAGKLSAIAGLDMEMTSAAYQKHLKQLIESGEVSMDVLDDMVRNILRVKIQLGLFESPYIPDHHPGQMYADESLASAYDAAVNSFVLLKNNKVLPLNTSDKIFLTGPLSDAPHDQLGTWSFDGDKAHTVTVKDAFESNSSTQFINGLNYSRDTSKKQFRATLAKAQKADVIVFVGGEEAILSGEAHSRADIRLPGIQEELLLELSQTGKPIVLVIMAGRPINIMAVLPHVDAVLMAWHPGTNGGPALYDVLTGSREPGGRLPITWPKSAGQSPIYYNQKNTGRPADKESFVHMDDIPVGAWQSSLGNKSHYLDAGFLPAFPFGYGLTYTSFDYSNLQLSDTTMNDAGNIKMIVTLTNTGSRKGTEIVQLYLQDQTASITRPVKELKDYQKVTLLAGESREIEFIINASQLTFYNNDNKMVLEPGVFNVFVGGNSQHVLSNSFRFE
ncbi:beta-glucosidase BglX [Carboxylicivirga sp. M1479]|uniref:beta-glucosidase BglX n=1 Tax=Carboxylicivirga sp. M1479 TaxID=2594476 RepID=UPI0011785D0A|nr:beta-glucosidase BglX [Carboxylicivirga sp. M1479]TRX71796.1 beta-glucosidase BglX [Carboxylicivirga sp. M1479]